MEHEICTKAKICAAANVERHGATIGQSAPHNDARDDCANAFATEVSRLYAVLI